MQFNGGEQYRVPDIEPAEGTPDLSDFCKDLETELKMALDVLLPFLTLETDLNDSDTTESLQKRLEMIDLVALRIEMKLTLEEVSNETLSADQLQARLISMKARLGKSPIGTLEVIWDALEGMEAHLRRIQSLR